MADEKKEQDQAAQEELILIIANRPKSFESAANFLSRRGFPCSAVSDFKQALKVITQRKPSYVFLSWNLRNSNVHKSYALVAKTFKIKTIVFAENTDSKTAAELAAAQLPEIMQAPVSGPGMYMRIQKIMKAREEAAAEPSHSEANSQAPIAVEASAVPQEGAWEAAGKDEKSGKTVWKFKAEKPGPSGKNGVYTFKGEKPPQKSKDGKWESSEADSKGGFTFEATSPLARASGGASGKSAFVDIDAESLSDQEIEALASQVLTGKAPAAPAEEEDDGFGSIMKIGTKPKDRAPGMSVKKEDEEKKDSGLQMFGREKSEGKDITLNREATLGKDMRATQEGANSREFEIGTKGPGQGKEHSIEQAALESKEHQAMFHKSDQATGKDFLLKHTTAPKLKGRGTDSILAQSAVKALESVAVSEGGEVTELNMVQNVIVFAIKSPRFKGYIVATSSHQGAMDKGLAEGLKRKIFENLKESGESPSEYEQLDCKIEEVDFKSWSEQNAEFLATADHKKEEVALAFIPHDKVLPVIEEHEGSEMLAVDIEDVLPDAKLNFDLYIFLPVNKRHFKYIRKGLPIAIGQRDRMKTAEMKRFYIRKEDAKLFQEFCVENNLNAKIIGLEPIKRAG